ncbi:hypothetical protein HK102_011578, partial [Quaeritorhiza haematococci]
MVPPEQALEIVSESLSAERRAQYFETLLRTGGVSDKNVENALKTSMEGAAGDESRAKARWRKLRVGWKELVRQELERRWAEQPQGFEIWSFLADNYRIDNKGDDWRSVASSSPTTTTAPDSLPSPTPLSPGGSQPGDLQNVKLTPQPQQLLQLLSLLPTPPPQTTCSKMFPSEPLPSAASPSRRSIMIFSDFDGTITTEDTGTALIDRCMGYDRRRALDHAIFEGKKTFRDAVTEMWD